MPIIYQKRIHRADLRANPKQLYVFGDNLQRVGMGGQAAEMRGEPNALGIPTKRSPGIGPDDFFHDADLNQISDELFPDLNYLHDFVTNGGTVVFPADGIGTGLSELPTRAPKVWTYLSAVLALCGIDGAGQSGDPL